MHLEPAVGDGAPQVPFPLRATGVLLGCSTALSGLLYFATAGVALGPFLLWPRTRQHAMTALAAGAGRLLAVERWRRSVFFGDHFPDRRVPGRRALRYLAARTYTGLLTGVVLGLLGFGIILVGVVVESLARGTLSWSVQEWLTQVVVGGVLLFLDLQGLVSLQALDARLARECFGPSEREVLQRRIDELATSRAAVLQAVDAERRRIERDLHDGVQQRLVALAMLLGRARRGRTPEQAGALLEQAHAESQEVLDDLREVAWRVYPAALDNLGLQEALAGVSERCAIPMRIDFDVPAPLPASVETAAYFVVSESVTNAAKHSGATRISVSARRQRTHRAARPGRRARRPSARPQPRRGPHHDHRGAAVRVMLAEDSTLLREGLVRLLAEEGHEVLAAVGDAASLLREVEAGPPDIVVADIRMPPTHTDEGLRAAVEIRERWPGVGVLVLSQHIERSYAARLLHANAERVGYLLKDRVAQVEEFLDALERIHAGGAAIDPEVVRQLVIRTTHTDPLTRLTPRERTVLEVLAQGHTNAAIGERLHISLSAVEKNLNAIFDKLELPHATGYNRRILAVLRFLES
jgi:DNA-binding NarL/FixJ family response regulator/signal transduction histidine kinase